MSNCTFKHGQIIPCQFDVDKSILKWQSELPGGLIVRLPDFRCYGWAQPQVRELSSHRHVCLATQSCLTLWRPRTIAPRLLCPWDFLGKNGSVGFHFLFWGIFLTQGSNPHLLLLLHWQVDSSLLSHQGSS